MLATLLQNLFEFLFNLFDKLKKTNYIQDMIKIQKNPNFSNWFQVFAFGNLIDEFNKQRKALRFARALAEESRVQHISVEGEIQSL
jgi:hypothetical protein